MKLIIFGLGSIGKRHAKILLNNFNHAVIAFRSNINCKHNKLGIREVYNWKVVRDEKPDVAFITNPTFLHLKTAIRCANLGIHLFIEKPLSDNLKGISLLEAKCKEKKLTCYIAYGLRFHPVIKKIRGLIKGKKIYHARVVCSSYLPDWRPSQNFKKSYSASHKKGGGILLDLSHELDYIRYIFGKIKSIKGSFGRASNLTVNCEDFADLLLTVDNGIHVNLHLNFLSHINERRIKIDFDKGYIIGDLIRKEVDYFCRRKRQIFRFNIGRDEYLKEQARYFFNNLGNKKIMNSLREAKELLRQIIEFKKATRN